MQEDEIDEPHGDPDVPVDSKSAADGALSGADAGEDDADKPATHSSDSGSGGGSSRLRDAAKGAIFREVVLAKVREMKEKETALKVEKEAHEKDAKRRSFHE